MTEGRVEALRREFDAAFAALPLAGSSDLVDLVAIGVSGDPHALRVEELAGLVPCRRVVPVPSRTPGLLGVAGIRGTVVSVYSLERLLGYPAIEAVPTWLALARGGGSAELVGFGFSEVSGFLRLPRQRVLQRALPEGKSGAAASVVEHDGTARSIIDIASMCEVIKRRTGTPGTAKEG